MNESQSPSRPERPEPTRLGKILTAVFFFAVLMGPGPGVYLVTPPPGQPPPTLFGVPALYVWAVFWFFVMAGVILVAYQRLWTDK